MTWDRMCLLLFVLVPPCSCGGGCGRERAQAALPGAGRAEVVAVAGREQMAVREATGPAVKVTATASPGSTFATQVREGS
jgi:hypothetical protein